MLTDGAGAMLWDASYRPFGAVTVAGLAAFDQRFPGQTADAETGYYDNWNRTYDPQLGRYLQSDPIGLAGGPNTYAYVGGNPVMLADPTGEILPAIAYAVYQVAVIGSTSYGLGRVAGRLLLIVGKYTLGGCLDRTQVMALGESLAWAAGGVVGSVAIVGGYKAYKGWKGWKNARRPADVDDLVNMMNKRSDVTAEFAADDMERFLRKMEAEGSTMEMLDNPIRFHIALRRDVATRRTALHEWLHVSLWRRNGGPRPNEDAFIESFLDRHKKLFRID